MKLSSVQVGMKLMVLVALALFSLSSSAQGRERIAGDIADPADWPSFVAFSDQETDLYNRCAGVLLRPRWVLTAPNGCMADRRDDAFAYIGATERESVSLDNDIGIYDGEKVGIEQVYLHPRYNSDQMVWAVNPTWNIGLVKLRRPVRGIPAPRFATYKPKPGSKITSVGLGNSMLVGSEDNVYPGLLESAVEVVSRKECTKYLPGRQGMDSRSVFCAFTPYRGPCTLDDGTGAFQGGKLVGVFNLVWNGQSNPACPEGRGTGYYTALAPSLPWIRSVLKRGYDRGRFIEHGAYIFPDRELNLYSWTNQEVFQPRVRLSEKICMKGKKRCFVPGEWLPLTENITAGAKRGNYWMFRDTIRFPSKGRCLRGAVKARFIYSRESGRKVTVTKPFRACVQKKDEGW